MNASEKDAKAFSWPSYPASDVEFERLMQAVDAELSRRGLAPFQRPLNVSRLFGEAFGWSGRVLPEGELADQDGFVGDVLMAKAHRWYETVFGDRLRGCMQYGHFPVWLGNSVWSCRAGMYWGSVTFLIDRDLSFPSGDQKKHMKTVCNALAEVSGLTQGLASRLADSELQSFRTIFATALPALKWRGSLPRSELFVAAANDLESSTSDLVAGRIAQSRWAAQQAIEKSLKGCLALAGKRYPKSGKDAHSLLELGELMKRDMGCDLNGRHLVAASCTPKMRYGEESCTPLQAIAANHAVLNSLSELSRAQSIRKLVAGTKRRTD